MKVPTPIIVLTGGPCGGKTTLMQGLRGEDPHAGRWIMVPEAAPLLFRAGLDGRHPEFQNAVVQLQTALEDACVSAARSGQVVLCHRGTLDPLAYWLRNGWDEADFFALTETTREEQLQRYLGVIQLRSVAIGAEAIYRRWPDAHRPETVEQAAETDRLCERVWQQHPRFVMIDNTAPSWADKEQATRTAIARLLSAVA